VRKLLVVAALVLVSFATDARAGEFLQGDHPVRDRYIVVLEEGAALPPGVPPVPGLSVREVVSRLTLLHGGKAMRFFENALQGGFVHATEAQARRLAEAPGVAYVEEDQLLSLSAYQASPSNWGLDRIDERDRPLNNHFTYTTTGAGVNAYVIDTGIDDSDYMDFASPAVDAFTAITDTSGNPLHGDCNGHGTKVAKALGGAISGVAKGVKLHAIRVATICNCGTGTGSGNPDPPLTSTGTCAGILLSDALAGIDWVTANRIKPAVANLSFGGGANQSLDDAVRGMISAGVVAVIAAGNSGVSACNVSPARVTEALTVGASDSSDARAIFSSSFSSNFGSCVDLFAPGKDLGLWNTGSFSGTSGAAPLVAGAVARYLQSTPAATPGQAHSYIVNNATVGRLTGIGTGSPNRLLFSPPGGPETDNPPVANFNFSCSGRTCTFTSASTDDFGSPTCSFPGGWQWSDGTYCDVFYNAPCSGCSLTHTFPAGGSYNVTLTVYDDTWHSSSKTRTVTVP